MGPQYLQRGLMMSLVVFACAAAAQVTMEREVKPIPGEVEQSKAAIQDSLFKAKRPSILSTLEKTAMSPAKRIALKPKHLVEKPERTSFWPGLLRNVVIVKFVDGARVREEQESASPQRRARRDAPTVNTRLDALKPQTQQFDDYDRDLLSRADLSPQQVRREMDDVRSLLKSRRVGHWHKLFEIDDETLERFRVNAEIRKGRQSSDLSNYYAFELEEGDRGEELADQLNRFKVVEIAYLPPVPEDADVAPPTPNFQGKQGYLNAAPNGIDAKFAWTIPGGKGNLIRIIDIESGWNPNHEDLPSLFITDGRNDDDKSRQHGTAVLSVMVGREDGTGITGIVPQAGAGMVTINRDLGIAYKQNVAEAVLLAAMKLAVGDVIVIEQHSRGPGNDGDCTACINPKPSSDCGYIAMEYWNDIFDAVNAATAAGTIVVQAAGNGEMNLDHSRYKDRFDRNVRNSGSIIVGASESTSRLPTCFTNFGSRVDLHGWGDDVASAGYGEPKSMQANGNDDTQWYTDDFNGTSSATPIVAGAVAAIQGIQIANNNPPLDWFEMADLLKKTGTAQTGGKNIGPLPDLKAAIAQLSPPAKVDAVYETTIELDATLLDADREVSGFKGSRTRTLGEEAPLGAIDRLEFAERSDRPCYVKVEKADILARSGLKPHAELDICGDRGPTGRSSYSIPLLTPSHDKYVRGVAVCNSKTGNSTRLKGVKLYQVEVESDGSLSMISNPVTMDRPNCDGNWKTPAMCPTGSVATKLIVHIRPDGNDEVFTGLSLKCKEVKVTKICVSGC
ncbi:MAG TPA: S8 family peptidase [Thermoanaerobaculia bacterium]|nr:S8 family peptidase [Thermoanaerobaculia bacterium]